MTKLRHYDHLGTARFVTFSCYHRYPLLREEATIRILLEDVRRIREDYQIKIYGYVVMPEHVHLVLHPADGIRLGAVIGRLKGLSSLQIQSSCAKSRPVLSTGTSLSAAFPVVRDGRVKNVFWQRRCYDHNCRTPESVIEKIEYCHNNPVKRGLVSDPAQWPWSSFNWYQGMNSVPPEMDVVE